MGSDPLDFRHLAPLAYNDDDSFLTSTLIARWKFGPDQESSSASESSLGASCSAPSAAMAASSAPAAVPPLFVVAAKRCPAIGKIYSLAIEIGVMPFCDYSRIRIRRASLSLRLSLANRLSMSLFKSQLGFFGAIFVRS